MTMRVKPVISMIAAGRNPTAVMRRRACTETDHDVPPPAAGALVTSGRSWAGAATAAPAKAKPTISASMPKMPKLFRIPAPEAREDLREGVGNRVGARVFTFRTRHRGERLHRT